MSDVKQEIKVGSIVKLRCGGPRMAVGKIEGGIATCYWFRETYERPLSANVGLHPTPHTIYDSNVSKADIYLDALE